MVFGAMSNETLSLILLAICVLPIAVLIVIAVVKMVVNLKKANDTYKDSLEDGIISNEQRTLFYDALGGEGNVTSVENEMNRIIINVIDVEVVNAEKLQELGATGILIAGNIVKCGFGDRAKNVYELLK